MELARSVSGHMGTKTCGGQPSDRLILSHTHIVSLWVGGLGQPPGLSTWETMGEPRECGSSFRRHPASL